MAQSLLSPVNLGSLELKNRTFMAPLTRSRAANAELAPFELHAEYYSQRSSAGLIVTEATIVSPQGRGYINTPGIYSEAQIAGWKLVTDAVHEAGGKIFCQLWHVGRISHPDFHNGELPVAPSAVNPESQCYTSSGLKDTVTPRALTTEEIAGIVQDFKNGAVNAMAAGFDGVELHASNGYLIHQFFNNNSNQRTDQYGGSDENKTRFFFEVLEAVQSVVPADRVGARFNPMMHGGMGMEVDEETAGTFDYLFNKLNDYTLSYAHITRSAPDKIDAPYYIKDVIGHYRNLYKGFLIANGGYTQESGEQEIAAGRADAIAYGSLFIANPDLPVRFENGWELADSDQKTWYSPGPKGYTDYPAYQPATA